MLGKRIAIGTGIATAVACVAIAAPGGAAHSLDHQHDGARSARTTMPAWRVGLEVRSEALNRRYRLGQYALSPSSAGADAAWERGLFLRSDALNRLYGLGAYAKSGH
jgi:hypothetical protein